MPTSLVIIDDNLSFTKSLRKGIVHWIPSFYTNDIILLPNSDFRDEELIAEFLISKKEHIKAVLINANLKLDDQDRRIACRGLRLYEKIVFLERHFLIGIFSFESFHVLSKLKEYGYLLDDKDYFWQLPVDIKNSTLMNVLKVV